MDESADILRTRCAARIADPHRTIADRLTGRSPRTPGSFAAFADAHAAEFTMVSPDGALLRRKDLLPGCEGAHGAAPGLSIEIIGVDVVRVDAASVVAIYEEWQDGQDGRTGRRSTVLFDRDPAAPRSLHLRHLQETWISRG
ncbi:DUF4440 domain-containing protein [Pseudonocardia asaccharolytica]|uniref:Uncharacterized protein n=1 Tax=Pseudonocardia asaccharolytica DSM 44247 = NBRC 16224 TaxID=1123024 RepID=A0A511D4F0_9PSEU|nr:DUF4440 domain-containing protein [Pseudonocardia asaccharolytica]GEL19655.1 hypothetical protein PA7_34920 [Pseudonocardia asaccharolytica DSM 44247 = NBRC 16224]